MTRKIIAIFAALLITASLCACGNGNDTEDTTGNNINIGGNEDTESTGNNDTESGDEDETTDQGGEEGEDVTFNPLDTKQTVYVLHANGAVNLRTAPNYDASSVYTSVTNGTELLKVAVSTGGDWAKVEYEGEEYYIVTKAITELADLDAGFVEVSKTLVKAEGSLKIRIEPAMSDKDAIGHYNEGDTVKVVAENTATGWYKVEFVNANNDTVYGYIASNPEYFVGGEEESSGNENTDVTEGYAIFNDGSISFEYPENWEKMAGFDNMMLDSTTGNSVNVTIEAYNAEYDMYFTLDNNTFASTFIPVYENAGMQITDYQVSQTTKGDNKVAVISFKNTSNGVAMYQTQYVTVVNSEKFYTVTVTEVSPDSTFAEDIYESLTFLG